MVVPAVSERTYSLMLVKPLTSGTLKGLQKGGCTSLVESIEFRTRAESLSVLSKQGPRSGSRVDNDDGNIAKLNLVY